MHGATLECLLNRRNPSALELCRREHVGRLIARFQLDSISRTALNSVSPSVPRRCSRLSFHQPRARFKSMKSAVVHVGLHKTGTTSIQSSLDNYNDGNTAYANLGDSNHSIFLKTLFHPTNLFNYWQNRDLSPAKHKELIDQYWQTLNTQLRQNQSRLIFSGEEISTLEPEALSRMKSHFEKQGRDIEIFVFVREPLSMTASLMQELVKWGTFLQNESTEADTINYLVSTRVGNLLQVFGKEKTHIFHYEDAFSSRYPRGVIDYFAELLGIPSESLPTAHTTNQSVGETTYKLLNQFFKTDIVHNKGAMLHSARWDFIGMLNEAVDNGARKKISINTFRSKVNWEDYKKLNSFLARPYEINHLQYSELEPFSRYCNDINHAEVCRDLQTYFEQKSIPVPANCNTHELVTLLFYHALQEHATKSVGAMLRDAQKQIQRMEDRFNISKKLSLLTKRFAHRVLGKL